MPNLSKINSFLSGKNDNIRSGNDSTDAIHDGKKVNLEGDFAKYLISNEEMEQYEAEYQRCANALAAGNSNPDALMPGTGNLLSRQKPEIHVSPTRNRDSGNLSSSTEKLISISSLAQVKVGKGIRTHYCINFIKNFIIKDNWNGIETHVIVDFFLIEIYFY